CTSICLECQGMGQVDGGAFQCSNRNTFPDTRLVLPKTELAQGEGHLTRKRPTVRTGPDDGSPALAQGESAGHPDRRRSERERLRCQNPRKKKRPTKRVLALRDLDQ